ncbi:PKD domain-containing protein [Actinocrinis sp.]|uniref:PKD domain-containing protein n=1 Tax=Actinocrinis sp. TaxID=1920516 RepID=UPI002D3AC975|nr:PKD domain-containing protein [Actinocrinis sp.]HZP52441.1 PKD domain-containing protein [Actinocrinis sp.]
MLITAASITPVAHAAAATGTTIYVNNAASANCSNSGPGTSAAPFCTIQQGVDAATAGTTVLVEPGFYSAPVTISKTGTADAPITISSVGKYQAEVSLSTGPAITVSNSAYVTIEGLSVNAISGKSIVVDDSSHVTMDSIQDFLGNSDPNPVIEITGTSTYATVSRSLINTDGHSAAIQIDSGSTHDTITTNVFDGHSGGVVVNGATNTVVTSNSFYIACNQAIALRGASTGASVENNAIYQIQDSSQVSFCPPTVAPVTGIEVDSGATSGTTADFNVLDTTINADSYTWAGTTYSSATDLNRATGQAAHDINADFQLTVDYKPNGDSSPLVDSADANAPGELTTDYTGAARADDPNVANTGTGVGYYDRGAGEYQDPLAVAVNLDSQTGTAPATFTATESLATAGWAPVTTWTVDFGDGSPTKSTASPSAISHTYTKSGAFTVTVTGTDSYGTASATAPVWMLSSSVYHPLSPSRILDTRKGIGTNGVVAPVPAGGNQAVTIEGTGSIPATGVTAVAVNITVTNAKGGGYITAYADGTTRPTTSNLDFSAGQTVPNMAIVPVGADGKIELYNGSGGTTDLIADVAGYYGQGAGTGLGALGAGPVRILDTRDGTGTAKAPIAAGNTLAFGSDYFTGVSAVELNVTIVNPKTAGYLTVYPDGTARPVASNLDFSAGQTIANQVVVPVGADGKIDFYNGSGGTTDVIADMVALFNTFGGGGYVPVTPTRLLDTRKGIGAPAAAVTAQGIVNLKAVGASPIPATGVGAIAANVTVTQPTSGGYLTVYPNYLNTPPKASTLDFAANETVPDFLVSGIEFDGVKLFNGSGGSSQLILDAFGYYDNGVPPAN